MSSVTIKICDAENIESAVVLLRAQLQEHGITTSTEDLREVARAVVDDPRHGFLLLARTNGKSVGLAYAAAHLSAEFGGMVGWLEELYVEPQWRARGVGSSLLDEVIARAQALDWRGLELEIVAGHERAVPLYCRHGFQPLTRARFSRSFER